jgi:hypothetical protein
VRVARQSTARDDLADSLSCLHERRSSAELVERRGIEVTAPASVRAVLERMLQDAELRAESETPFHSYEAQEEADVLRTAIQLMDQQQNRDVQLAKDVSTMLSDAVKLLDLARERLAQTKK